MLNVLCTSLSGEEGPHFELLRDAGFECRVVDRDVDLWNEPSFAAALQGCHAVIAGAEPYTPGILSNCPDLRVISRTGVGFDAVDLAAGGFRRLSRTPFGLTIPLVCAAIGERSRLDGRVRLGSESFHLFQLAWMIRRKVGCLADVLLQIVKLPIGALLWLDCLPVAHSHGNL